MPRSENAASSDLTPAPMRFFEGFAWAVPVAFSGALAAFRFEQGDVLFRDRAAYAALASAPPGGSSIQVLLPPRSARSAPGEIEGDRRSQNWASEVEITLVGLADGRIEVRRISQGKLLMALWSGDDDWLDPDRPEPPLLRAARELAGQLPQAAATFDERFRTRQGSRFLFVVDVASDASRVKARSVAEALGKLASCETLDLTPAEAGLEAPETFHPALVVRGIAVEGPTEARVQAALREALYTGGAKVETDGESATDRFSVGRHGLLAPIGV